MRAHEQPALDIDVGPGQLHLIAPRPTVRTVPLMHDDPTAPNAAPVLTVELGPVPADVLRFHEAFDLPRSASPTTDIDDDLAQLRLALLREEVSEFAAATAARDLVGLADALADIVYVAYGAALTYGIDLDAVVHEVHRANMSKLDARGRPVLRADGKVLKSPLYRPPAVDAVLQNQLPLFDTDAAHSATDHSAAG